MNDQERILTAQWIFERHLAWIAASEVKVGAIVAIDTAMLGGLGAAFSSIKASSLTPCAYVWVVGAALALAGGLLCAAMAVLPRVDGPEKSLLFFGRIGQLSRDDYSAQFKAASVEHLLDDWTAQIHRNAQIAGTKFAWVRRSMWFSFLSLLPWFPALVLLLKK